MNEVANDVTMTNAQARELEAIADPAAKQECRRRQLAELEVEACAHGTPRDQRCFLCEPIRYHLFPPRRRE